MSATAVPRGTCAWCKKEIKVTIFRDELYCCDDHRKALGLDLR